MMQRFKITNKRRAVFRLNTLIILALLNFLYQVYLTKFFSNFYLFSFSLFILINLVIIIFILRLEYFEYDSSGEVISIRTKHPLFRNTEKRTEFPKDRLYDFWISQNCLGTIYLKFGVENYNSKKIKVNHKLYCCDKENLRKIQTSIQKLKQLNIPTEY